MAAKKKSLKKKYFALKVIEEQLSYICFAQGSRFAVTFPQEQCRAVKNSHNKGRTKLLYCIFNCSQAKKTLSHWCPYSGLQQYRDALVVYVHRRTGGLCPSNLFYYIYFQVEQPQLPNNDIKSAGIPAQAESMLTRVITETTCWGSNSFQISGCCSLCTGINLVTCLKGCRAVV